MEEEKVEEQGHNRSWLKRVAEQSWEPELLISGLAIFATSQLPEVLRNAYHFYEYNLQTDVNFIDAGLPVTIISAFITAVELLYFAFILHFSVRAFWVGLIGLNSVFTNGIQFEKLEYSKIYQEEVKKRIGSSESFLISVDKLASVVFSVAFTFVLLLIGVGVAYTVFFLLMNGVKIVLSDENFEIYSKVIFTIMGVLLSSIVIASLVLNLKRFRENEKIARIHFTISWYSSFIILPFMIKPIQFLMLTFMSNIPMKRYYTFMSLFFVLFMGMLMNTTLKLQVGQIFNSRTYYATTSEASTFNQSEYETTFDGEIVRLPMISSQFVERGKYLSLFIPYSKMLDFKLEQFCEVDEPDEELERFEIRRMLNEGRIACANNFFSISIENELTFETDLLFGDHSITRQNGYYSNLMIPDSLEIGKYELQIRRPVIDDDDMEIDSLGRRLSFESNIPFWIQ